MKRVTAALAVLVIAATTLTFTPTASASSCTGGAAAVHCQFICTTWQGITVSATGAPGASVKAVCGNVTVICTATGTFTNCTRWGPPAQYVATGTCFVNSLQTVLVSCSG